MNITCIVFGMVFLFVGVWFFIGKAHEHIEGYKRMSEEEKANIKIKPLCKNIGIVIGLAGIGFLGAGLITIFANKIFIWYMIAWFVGTGLDVRYISKSSRFTNNPQESGLHR